MKLLTGLVGLCVSMATFGAALSVGAQVWTYPSVWAFCLPYVAGALAMAIIVAVFVYIWERWV